MLASGLPARTLHCTRKLLRETELQTRVTVPPRHSALQWPRSHFRQNQTLTFRFFHRGPFQIVKPEPRSKGFPGSSAGKEFACSAGDLGSIPGSGRSPGKGNGNPLQYSCLENPMDRGAWRGTAHGVATVRHDLVTKPPPRTITCLLIKLKI